jgi:hypothetical protein
MASDKEGLWKGIPKHVKEEFQSIEHMRTFRIRYGSINKKKFPQNDLLHCVACDFELLMTICLNKIFEPFSPATCERHFPMSQMSNTGFVFLENA